MAEKFPILPRNPERICWGRDKYYKEDDLQCGNGCERIQRPIELDGHGWYKKDDWSSLLDEEQQVEFGLKEAPKPAKPYIKLPLKNKTTQTAYRRQTK